MWHFQCWILPRAVNVTPTNTNLYVETGAAGAGASFPTGVCFLERDPSLHDYTIGFQCRGSKLQHQGIPSDCHHRLRSGTPLRDPRGKHATSFGFPQTGGAQGWRVEESEGPRGVAALLCLEGEENSFSVAVSHLLSFGLCFRACVFPVILDALKAEHEVTQDSSYSIGDGREGKVKCVTSVGSNDPFIIW